MRPLVGITPYLDHEGRIHRPGYYLYQSYTDVLVKYGMTPVVLPIHTSSMTQAIIEETLQHLDGVILSGGPDIDASLYGEEPEEPGDIERATYERHLFRRAVQQDIPVLGICLGLQTINVCCGGTLHQHIPDSFPESTFDHDDGGDGYQHPVDIVPGTMFEKLVGERAFEVNSFHHQAIKDLGPGLRIAGYSPDGVPEVVEWENPGRHFLLGVQWHPERQPDSDSSRLLFTAFAGACRARQAGTVARMSAQVDARVEARLRTEQLMASASGGHGNGRHLGGYTLAHRGRSTSQ